MTTVIGPLAYSWNGSELAAVGKFLILSLGIPMEGLCFICLFVLMAKCLSSPGAGSAQAVGDDVPIMFSCWGKSINGESRYFRALLPYSKAFSYSVYIATHSIFERISCYLTKPFDLDHRRHVRLAGNSLRELELPLREVWMADRMWRWWLHCERIPWKVSISRLSTHDF